MAKSTSLRSLTLVSALSLFVGNGYALAGVDSNGYVGGVFGLQVPDAEDSSARAAFGIVGGAKLGTEFAVGAYYLTSSKEEKQNSGFKGDFNYSMYGVEGAYHFEGEAAGVYLGVRLGLTNIESQTALGSFDYAPYHFGLLAGYNHWIMDSVSLGGEATFFNVGGDEDVTAAGVKVTQKSFNIISFLASAKFWF